MLKSLQMMISISSSSSSSLSSSTSTSGLFPNRIKSINHLGFSISSIPFSLPKTRTFSLLPLSTRKKKGLFFRELRMSSTKSESISVAPSSSDSSANIRKVNFCQWCGGATKYEVPDGDEKIRAICSMCGKIAYQNPKMVVGCLFEHENKVLLCKRNIQPSYGRWTLPAGYMEMGESAAEGAVRETQEEAGADVEVSSPFAQLDIPLIGQTYIIFLAKLKRLHFSPGPESMECRLFSLDEIPFDSLAFSSMVVTLKLYIEDMKVGKPRFHYGTINKRPGTCPSDIHAFTLDYHLQP